MAHAHDNIEKARLRISFDAGSAATEYDSLARSPIITDHDHGLGLSGLRRIRQQPPMRAPTLSSATSNPSPNSPAAANLPRSASMLAFPMHFASGPSSPNFTEDLHRFPSESLHSFSFAHQSEDYMHNRQSILKRSIDFINDRKGLSISPTAAAIASAEARVAGDSETQGMLDLISKAQLIGMGEGSALSLLSGPLTGPAQLSGENVFEREFIPRSESPDTYSNSEGTIAPPPLASDHSSNNLKSDTAADNSTKLIPDTTSSTLVPPDSEGSSRTPTNESGTTDATSPPASTISLKRTLTDTGPVSIQQKLVDAMAQPYMAMNPDQLVSPSAPQSVASSPSVPGPIVPAPVTSAAHSHATRWVPAAQAIFTTQAKPPWTILAANDLACLVFGVTKAEVRKMGILEVVQDERRSWLERKLLHKEENGESPIKHTPMPAHAQTPLPSVSPSKHESSKPQSSRPTSSLLGIRGGITAQLLNKPNSRAQAPKKPKDASIARRAQTVHGTDSSPSKGRLSINNHHSSQSRGVLLCGDVVPIQKRNGATGSASIWVKEKKIGLIWVVEEIHEDVAFVAIDDEGTISKVSGDTGPIWGETEIKTGTDIGKLIPRIPRQGIDPRFGEVDFAQISNRRFFTCRNCERINIPATVEQVRGKMELRVSCFPHIAGIVVVSPKTLTIQSSNAVFSSALFGYEKPDSLPITHLIPDFDKILRILTDENDIHLVEGIVVPEHSFRKASAFLALREGRPEGATAFLRPDGLKAKHRDGTDLKIDIQMRVVRSEKQGPLVASLPSSSEAYGAQKPLFDITDETESESAGELTPQSQPQPEMVHALWITYSRHLHATRANLGAASPLLSGAATPLRQPSPGQTPAPTPPEISDSDDPHMDSAGKEIRSFTSKVTQRTKIIEPNVVPKIEEGATLKPEEPPRPAASLTATAKAPTATTATMSVTVTTAPSSASSTVAAASKPKKKTIDDFVILEEMGQGAYGQVKLARYKEGLKKIVLKFVTKRRILVDTWTRDRKLGTVPLEIHVLNFLRRDDLKHPNVVEMADFFEDDINYYIEMVPHGLPGMDLFDYIELRANMGENEARSIFVQCARALHHLHTKAMVVHRDIKDENVILDGEGNIKLIDFGSAAYIKNGPFDVFVGTIGMVISDVMTHSPEKSRPHGSSRLGSKLTKYDVIFIDYAAPEVLTGTQYDGRAQDVWALGILLYTIIYKENPFYSIDEIMDHDLRVPWKLSDDSVDLIRHMLLRPIEQRYTIEQVLDHAWCKAPEKE
ncbi:serine/threonine protein kinase [Zalerion maritima]|uniref:Serine/threonine protein kinase n=1 Tax=Zalerion maritima TaxID=339359 RepID=A0AAD5RMA6_9PEZI|nr:serine/threonine protein kinase [Zalerion maritima]